MIGSVAINIDGNIKMFSNGIPEKWGKPTIHYYHTLEEDIHYEDGFRPFVTPTLTAGQKLGAMIYDAVNDVFTYAVVSKSPVDLEQETAAQKEINRSEIGEKYQKRTVENAIALNPVDAEAYFYPWTAGTYQIDQIRRYLGKTYRNTVANNTNAPDKGGWLEIK